MGDECGKLATLQKNAGDFRDAPGTDAVEHTDDFFHPDLGKSIGESFVNGALAAGWQGTGFFGEFHRISGKQKIGEADGGGIEFESLGGTDDFIAGGDELQRLAELDAGGLFRAFVDVAEQALEGFGVVFEGTDVRGDGFEGADHALDIAGGLEISDERLGGTLVAGAEDDGFGAFLWNDGQAALAKSLFGGVPPFFETGLGNDGSAEFFLQGIARHAAAVALEQMDDEFDGVAF